MVEVAPQNSGWKLWDTIQHPSGLLTQSTQSPATFLLPARMEVSTQWHFAVSPGQGCLVWVGAGAGCLERCHHVGPGPDVPN